jgi:uncharacterized linocin/CFP29 family protein
VVITTWPGPGEPEGAGIREEGQEASRRARAVPIVQVVGRRVIKVDRLLDQSKAENVGVEIEVLLGVAAKRGQVMESGDQMHPDMVTRTRCFTIEP